jgi:type IV fimbrial biogenesis protein FimT
MLKSDQSGFSLIELLIGVVILGLLASVAFPSFQAWLHNSQIRNAAESIANGLQRARAEAVARNTNVEFILAADSSWSVRVVVDGTVIDSHVGEVTQNGPSKVAVTTTPAINNTVTYNSFGSLVPINPGDGSAPFTQADVDSNFLSAAESRDLRITLNLSGIKMCDPNVPTGNTFAC